jgi:hypothetical protein
MSTFLPGMTESIPETPLYHPDFNYFNQMLTKKTQMYNQGFSQVQSAYNSVLNAPLSDQANIPLRDQYVRQAQNKLKDLASSDLSLDSNVQSAQNVFAPFWEDDLMLKDVAYTKSAQTEMQKGQGYANSTDEKQRALYSETSMRDISNGLRQLQGAGRDASKYAKLQTRRYTPFVNIPDELDKAAKDANFKIDWTSDPTGPYLVETSNGQRSVKSFRAFAEGHLTPQMNEQFKVTGRVENEDRVFAYKNNNPHVTDQQAQDAIARDAADEYREGFKKTITGFTTDRDNIQNELNMLDKKIGSQVATPEQVDHIKQLTAERDSLGNQIEQKNKDYSAHWQDGADDFEKMVKGISTNPEHYFMNMSRNTTLDNWSIGRAANESRKITENPVWKTSTENDYKDKELQIENAKLDLEKQKVDIQRDALGLKYGPNGKLSGSGSGAYMLDPLTGALVANPNAEKVFQNEGHITGKDTDHVMKTADPATLYAADQSTKIAAVNDLVTSPDGLAGILTNVGAGVTHEDVVNIASNIKNMLRDPDGYMPNDEQRKSYAKVSNALAQQTGMKITGPGAFRNALVAYAGKYFTNRKNSAAAPLTPEEKNQILSFNKASDMLEELSTDRKLKEDMTQKVLSTTKDTDIQKLVFSRADGKKDLINANDLARRMQPVTVKGENGRLITIPAKRVAEAILSGNEDAVPTAVYSQPASAYVSPQLLGYSITLDGKSYDIQNGRSVVDNVYKLNDRFGNIGKIHQKLAEVNKQVIPNLPKYDGKTGSYGTQTQYDIPIRDPKDGPAEGTYLAQEIANPANHTNIYVNGELSTDKTLNPAILALAGTSQDSEHRNIVSVIHHTRGVTGTPSIELKFNPTISSNSKTMIGDEKLAELAGKTIELPISPDASGEHLQKLPSGSNAYIYGELLNGKAYKANAVTKAMGFDYTVKPDDPTHPTGAYVYVNRTVFKNGSSSPRDTPPIFVPFSGPNAKSPDEIMRSINQAVAAHMTEDDSNRTIYQNNAQNQGSTKTISDLIHGKQ